VQLHIVAEFAGYGSALAEPSDMTISDSESDSNVKHTTLSNLINLILFCTEKEIGLLMFCHVGGFHIKSSE
jgi:hypothetical protein